LTTAPGPAVETRPVKVGVVSLVIPSLLEAPESLEARSAGVLGPWASGAAQGAEGPGTAAGPFS
jgi:hypothetical protein